MKEYKIKNGLLARPRKLILTKDYIAFENSNLNSGQFIKLNKVDIIDFKRALERIVWYEFTVGYEYAFTFLDKDKKILDIRFKNYFGLESNYKQIYAEIIDLIWEYYFIDIVNIDIDEIYNNQNLEFNGIKVGLEGVKFINTNETVEWGNLDYKEYFRYFAVLKIDNPKFYQTFDFNDWNSERLFCLVRTLKKHMG